MQAQGVSTISKPILYIFSVSHFCEKACWALDYHGIEYEIRYLTPGFHVLTAKKLGVPGTTLPILVADGEVVQGSAEIIDWAEARASGASEPLTPDAGREDCLEIERRLDEVAGVHVRRYYYSAALFDQPEAVRKMYANDVTFFRRLLVNGTWGAVRKEMIKVMDLGPLIADALEKKPNQYLHRFAWRDKGKVGTEEERSKDIE